jgi:hypothetical protein
VQSEDALPFQKFLEYIFRPFSLRINRSDLFLELLFDLFDSLQDFVVFRISACCLGRLLSFSSFAHDRAHSGVSAAESSQRAV